MYLNRIYRPLCMAILFYVFTLGAAVSHELGSNKKPLSFGRDQTIIDLGKLVWEDLEVEGLAPGAEIAVLRGDLSAGASESVLRLPPGYVVPNHSHSSDELYIWIKGAFTLTAHDGSETKFTNPAYMSFPENAPPHGLKCGLQETCLFYLRYSRPFDIHYFPVPENQQSSLPTSLPYRNEIRSINIFPDPNQNKAIFSASTLLQAINRFKPAHVTPPAGGKVWWQRGELILKDGRRIPWRSYSKHVIALPTGTGTRYFSDLKGQTNTYNGRSTQHIYYQNVGDDG